MEIKQRYITSLGEYTSEEKAAQAIDKLVEEHLHKLAHRLLGLNAFHHRDILKLGDFLKDEIKNFVWLNDRLKEKELPKSDKDDCNCPYWHYGPCDC